MTKGSVTVQEPKPGSGTKRSPRVDSQLLVGAFALLSPWRLGLAAGIFSGAGLLLLTAILLLKATPGQPVGPHLALLSNYLPGFEVSWRGAVIGLGYGMLLGFVFGLVLAAIVNLQHLIFVRRIERRSRREAMFDGL